MNPDNKPCGVCKNPILSGELYFEHEGEPEHLNGCTQHTYTQNPDGTVTRTSRKLFSPHGIGGDTPIYTMWHR